jgi:hypothetical protein
MAQTQGAYYVPHGSHWPIVGSFGLLGTVGGAALWLDEFEIGKVVMAVGIALLVIMIVGWFGPSGAGGKYSALAGSRILDSRIGIGGYNTPWSGGERRDVLVTDVGGVPPVGGSLAYFNGRDTRRAGR